MATFLTQKPTYPADVKITGWVEIMITGSVVAAITKLKWPQNWDLPLKTSNLQRFKVILYRIGMKSSKHWGHIQVHQASWSTRFEKINQYISDDMAFIRRKIVSTAREISDDGKDAQRSMSFHSELTFYKLHHMMLLTPLQKADTWDSLNCTYKLRWQSEIWTKQWKLRPCDNV